MRGGYGENQMEELSNRGDGNYAYIDTLAEAQRALVDRLTASIFNIAKDVKLQLEVNPLLIKRHRLLGYENRAIADEDFRDDTVDAGEIGAGHTVTALIELERYAEGEAPSVEDLMMGEEQAQVDAAFLNTDAPLAVLRIRSKAPDAGTDDPAKEQRFELSQAELLGDVSEASDALRFGAAVAEFAEILRGSPYVAEIDFEAVKALANGAIIDQDPLMIEFVTIVERAQALFPSTQQP
jgi:Ca-activated chloride channel family protein